MSVTYGGSAPSGAVVKGDTAPFLTGRWRLRDQATLQDFTRAAVGAGEDDTDVFLKAAESGTPLIVLPKPADHYRINGQAATIITPGQRWRGEGEGVVIEQLVFGVGVFIVDTADRARIEGLKFLCEAARVPYPPDPVYDEGLGAAVFIVNSSRTTVGDLECDGFFALCYEWGPHADDGNSWDKFNRVYNLRSSNTDMTLLHQAQDGFILKGLQSDSVSYTFNPDKPPHAIYATGRDGLDGLNPPRTSKNCKFLGIVAEDNPHSAGLQFKFVKNITVEASVDNCVRGANFIGCDSIGGHIDVTNPVVDTDGTDSNQCAVDINGCVGGGIRVTGDIGAIDGMAGVTVRSSNRRSVDITIHDSDIQTEAANPDAGYVNRGGLRIKFADCSYHSEHVIGRAFRTTFEVDELGATHAAERTLIRDPMLTGSTHLLQVGDVTDSPDEQSLDTRLLFTQAHIFDGLDLINGIIDNGVGTIVEMSGSNPAPYYRPLIVVAGAATAAAAAGNKYVLGGSTDVVNRSTGATAPFWVPITAADLAPDLIPGNSALKTRLRVWAMVKTGTAPNVTITVGLYPVVAGASDTLGVVVPGSTLTIVNPAANSDVPGESADFDLPADGIYALGYTVSGAPAGAFAIAGRLEAHYVVA